MSYAAWHLAYFMFAMGRTIIKKHPAKRKYLRSSQAQIRRIDGRFQKRCPGCKEWKDVESGFYRTKTGRRAGNLRTYCKRCDQRRQGVGGLVPVERIEPFLTELINRVGKVEAARRVGRSYKWLWDATSGKTRGVQRETARRVLEALREVRERDEVRHRDSIHHGAARRGHQEKVAKSRLDFYRRQWL